ncbi:hypothetical protein V6N13_113571 [Hibiscus sabdariffa]
MVHSGFQQLICKLLLKTNEEHPLNLLAINPSYIEVATCTNINLAQMSSGLVRLEFLRLYVSFDACYSYQPRCQLLLDSRVTPFYHAGRGGLYEHIENRHMIIVIAEGAGKEPLSESLHSMDQQDVSGNKLLQDVGLWISHKIKKCHS